jgi:hypothetical protein
MPRGQIEYLFLTHAGDWRLTSTTAATRIGVGFASNKNAACTVDTMVVTIQVPNMSINRYRSFLSLIIINKRIGRNKRTLSDMMSAVKNCSIFLDRQGSRGRLERHSLTS